MTKRSSADRLWGAFIFGEELVSEEDVAGVREPERMDASSGEDMLELSEGSEENEGEKSEEEVEKRAADDSVGDASEVGKKGDGEKD